MLPLDALDYRTRQKRFGDPEAAREFIEAVRWNGPGSKRPAAPASTNAPLAGSSSRSRSGRSSRARGCR